MLDKAWQKSPGAVKSAAIDTRHRSCGLETNESRHGHLDSSQDASKASLPISSALSEVAANARPNTVQSMPFGSDDVSYNHEGSILDFDNAMGCINLLCYENMVWALGRMPYLRCRRKGFASHMGQVPHPVGRVTTSIGPSAPLPGLWRTCNGIRIFAGATSASQVSSYLSELAHLHLLSVTAGSFGASSWCEYCYRLLRSSGLAI